LFVADYFEQPDLSRIPLIHDSTWLKLIFVVTASYLAGHVLAAIGYTLYDIKIVKWVLDFVSKSTGQRQSTDSSPGADALFYRYIYPSMFIEADCREMLTIMRVALSVALVIAACLTDLWTNLRLPCVVAGIFMFWNGFVSRNVATGYSCLSVQAGMTAVKNNVPLFHWSGTGGSDGPDGQGAGAHAKLAASADSSSTTAAAPGSRGSR